MAFPYFKKVILSVLICFIAFYAEAQSDSVVNKIADSVLMPVKLDSGTPFNISSNYPKPQNFAFVTNVPSDLWQIAKSPFQKQNLIPLSAVVASTALLIWHDQSALNASKQLAENIHLTSQTKYKVLIDVAGTKVLKVPRNLTTAMYQIGQGGTSMLVAGGLYLYGKIKHDNRSLQTASDLAETFITMGVTTQLLKRSFGRESPSMATMPGGRWQPFPSFSNYQKNTTNYDAFPSGHLATLMASVTVISENYPEKKWIKPVGYSLCGIMGFTMMNIGVHWAGDYPLALAIGYLSGKITVSRHKNRPLNIEQLSY